MIKIYRKIAIVISNRKYINIQQRYFKQDIASSTGYICLQNDTAKKLLLSSTAMQAHIQGGLVYSQLVATRKENLSFPLRYILKIMFDIVGLPNAKTSISIKDNNMISESFTTIVRLENSQWSRWFQPINENKLLESKRISNFHSLFSFSSRDK